MSGLAGKYVVITRTTHQSAELAALLEAKGAIPLRYPCIEIQPPPDLSALDEALQGLAAGEFEWLIITSPNTVSIMANRLKALNLSLNHLSNLRIAAVGTATAHAIQRDLDVSVHTIPEIFTAAILAKSLDLAPETSVLLPQSELADSPLSDALSQMQVKLTAVTAYYNRLGSGGIHLLDYLHTQKLDSITFTSSSTVSNFVTRLQAEGGTLEQLRAVCVACIGPKTAATAQANDLDVAVMPQTHTLPALVDALHEHFSKQETNVYGYE